MENRKRRPFSGSDTHFPLARIELSVNTEKNE
jgi:hypothetical protein